MKKIVSYILLIAVMAGFMPYSILAETTDVGVNITGAVSIDVVTTISADMTIDLADLSSNSKGATMSSTYMEVQNNSGVPVNVKITDIETTSEGAPSTFVGENDVNWFDLNKEETSTYVNFRIFGSGQNVSVTTYKDILADTELELGTLARTYGSSEGYVGTDGLYTVFNYSNQAIYEIGANFGRNWDEGDKNFVYQITTVYSRADEYIEPNYSVVSHLSNVTDSDLWLEDELYGVNDDNRRDYVVLTYTINDTNQTFLDEDISVSVSYMTDDDGWFSQGAILETYQLGTETYSTFLIDEDGMGSYTYGMGYSFKAPERSLDGKTHYVKITVHGPTGYYSVIKKVIAVGE